MTSCNRVGQKYELANTISSKLQRILDTYKDSIPLKQNCAKFLVNNMTGHHYYSSSAIDGYTSLFNEKTSPTSKVIKERWDSLKSQDEPITVFDVDVLSYEFICDNIEQATKVWLQTPWHIDISEEVFLNYVLPYRVKDEPPSCIGWRDSLYNRYHPLIKDVDNLQHAFGIIHKYLMTEFRIHDIGGYPYLLSTMDSGKLKSGRCVNQSAYIVAVMRALGIPASLELIRNWANFSTNGHAWAALVTNDGTYTVERNDSIARRFNKIDSSIFSIKDTLETEFSHYGNFKKRISKVWRYTYIHNQSASTYNDSYSDNIITGYFRTPFLLDVTREYGYNNNIKIRSFGHRGYAYLCTFVTGHDWVPMAYSYSFWGNFSFESMPDSVIYLPVTYNSDKILTPISAPFVMTSLGKKEFQADTTLLQSMTIERKYPFSLISAKSWPQALDACFEASNEASFRVVDTLYLFSRTPVFRNEIEINSKKKYRYIRYRSHALRHAYISEIEAYSNGTLLKGEALGEGVCNPDACFDGDTYSFLDKVCSGSWVGVDLGNAMVIDKLVLYPKNDGNNVVKGKKYELYCFVDGKWKIYGEVQSNDYKVTFQNVPTNGVYRLHCIDGGVEEQIFTYEEGQQVWW